MRTANNQFTFTMVTAMSTMAKQSEEGKEEKKRERK
jgi:hypothetical protein